MNAIEFANKASRLFAIPETALKIKALSDSGTADMAQVVKVVSADPGLAAHILKLANSAIYRFSRKVEDLDKALQIIGLTSVYEFSLAFALADSLNEEHKKFINIDKYWYQSVCCALIAKKIADKQESSRLFLAGLFHNIGELAVLRIDPVLARDCAKLDKGRTPEISQLKNLGFTYAEISAALLQKWLLPDTVVSAVAMQHFDGLKSHSPESKVIQFSYACAVYLTYPDIFDVNQVVPEMLCQSVGYESDDLAELLNKAAEETKSTVNLFTFD